MYVFVEGPDGCGKTEISQALAKELGLPYFKVSTETKNWKNGTFKQSLAFDLLLPEFCAATEHQGFVMDRGFPSEWVYSQVFHRGTDYETLWKIDSSWAGLDAKIVVLLRNDYSSNRSDDLVSNDKLRPLHHKYVDFVHWTQCRVILMYVDDFENSLDLQIPALVKALRDDEYWPSSSNGIRFLYRKETTDDELQR